MTMDQETQFGKLVVRNGFASASEVELALDVQKQADPAENPAVPKIGEILVEMGTIDQKKLNALLVEQAILRKDPEPSELTPATATSLETSSPAQPSTTLPAVGETAPPPGAFKILLRRVGDKLKRLFRDVTGKRAREKAAASEQRDRLLVEIAQAAPASGPEADAVKKAAQGVEAAKKQTGVSGKGAIKAAEAKHQRALLKLGRLLVEKGPAPESAKAKIDEVKALDAKVKDLS